MASVQQTGNPYIDGVLVNLAWSTINLTYSFPTSGSLYSTYPSSEPSYNFEALNTSQKAAVRDVLDNYSAISNLTFTEITETASNSAIVRFAESDMRPTAWGYMPTGNAKAGDIWFNNSSNYYDNPKLGNYAWLTITHEIGHAMGLKHPHEASGFGVLPIDKDSMEYSVMSYRSYEQASTTSGYTNETYGFAQTLMMFDVAAIQQMYGANYTHNGDDTIYNWSRTTGELSINGDGQGAPGSNRIFMTVWDGGGTDTYDFSNYTVSLNIDLQPGGWTILASNQRASLGNSNLADGNIANSLLYHDDTRSLIENANGGTASDVIVGNQAINTLTGNAGSDQMFGLGGNDIFIGGTGNDYLEGGYGQDAAKFSSTASNYSWSENEDGTWTVTDLRSGKPDGIDTLKGIEVLQFSNSSIEIQEQEVEPVVTPPGDPIEAYLDDVVAAVKAILRIDLSQEDAIVEATKLVDGMSFDAYLAQLVERAQDSTVPALVVYDFVFGQTPDDSGLDSLAAFVNSQVFSTTYQATLNPRLGGYEAMGVGLSESDPVDNRYLGMSDEEFITSAYYDIFGRDALTGQVEHFQAQIDYFEWLYVAAGYQGPAETWAKGAALGQMLGFATFADDSIYATAANEYLNDLAQGTPLSGTSLFGDGLQAHHAGCPCGCGAPEWVAEEVA